MPKENASIKNFSGGLNNNTNSKDLLDNEFQVLDQLSNEVPGKLFPAGSTSTVSIGSNAITSIDGLIRGNGLLQTNLDRNIGSSGINETEYLFINDDNDHLVRIYDYTNSAVETPTIDYGDTAGKKVQMYNIDGAIRVVPEFGTSVGTNKPTIFAFHKFVRRLGGSDTAIDHEDTGSFSTNDLYIAPIRGRSNVDKYKPDEMYNSLADGFVNGFHTPGNGSEVFMFPATADDTSNPTRFGLTAQAAEEILDDWDNSGSGNPYTDDNEGGMGVFIGFSGDDLADTGSSIDVIPGTRYVLFASKVYKDFNGNKQESESIHIGHIDQSATSTKKQNLYFGLLGRMGGREKNYSGFKLYWAHVTDIDIVSGADGEINTGTLGPKYLFAEVDFEEGVRYAGSDSYSFLSTVTINSELQFEYPGNLYSNTSYAQPFEVTELKTAEPSLIDKGSVIGPANTGFKTSTILNRRLYVGNVQYENEDGELITKSDRVLKSLPNKFDVFPENSFIDVEVEDGDSIVKLESLGNKLLQFKKRNLFIINVSRDIEFLEASFNFKGCKKDYHVTKGDGFVAWFNEYGAYIFNGETVLDITLGANGQSKLANWSGDYYHDDMMLGYLPESKELLFLRTGTKTLIYDLKSESWRTRSMTVGTATNMVNFNDGDLYYFEPNPVEGGGTVTISLKKFNRGVSTISTGTLLKTKEYEMGSPSASKNFSALYIRYTGQNASNIMVKGFGTRKDNTDLTATNISALQDSNGAFKTLKLPLNDTFNNLLSMGIELAATSGVANDFEIDEISIVFRQKVVT